MLLWLQIKVFLTIIIILMCLTVSYCHIFDMYAPHLITHTITWCDIHLIIICSTIMRSIIMFCYNVYVCSVVSVILSHVHVIPGSIELYIHAKNDNYLSRSNLCRR